MLKAKLIDLGIVLTAIALQTGLEYLKTKNKILNQEPIQTTCE